VVGVIDANGPKYYSYGVKSLKRKEAVNEHSVFEIGSISKTFTGILLADGVIKGEMSLDDPLQNYFTGRSYCAHKKWSRDQTGTSD